MLLPGDDPDAHPRAPDAPGQPCVAKTAKLCRAMRGADVARGAWDHQEVLNSLTEQLKIVETDGKGTIVGHARSGAVLRELEDLLAAASTDGGAGEGFRMPSSAFLVSQLRPRCLFAGRDDVVKSAV